MIKCPFSSSGFRRLFEPFLTPTGPICTSDGSHPLIQVFVIIILIILTITIITSFLYNVPALKIFDVGDLLSLNVNQTEIMRMICRHLARTVFLIYQQNFLNSVSYQKFPSWQHFHPMLIPMLISNQQNHFHQGHSRKQYAINVFQRSTEAILSQQT